MKKSKLITASLVSGAVSLALFGAQDVQAGNADKEKCYGVAKVGKNDCAHSGGKHTCGGQATKDGDATEWVYVPKGLCEKLVGGSLGEQGAKSGCPAKAAAPAKANCGSK